MIHSKTDLPALLDAFKQYLYTEDASSNTTHAYLSDIGHFITWYIRNVQAFIIGEITPTDIRAYREFLQEQVPPAAPDTINRRLAALRRFFAWTKERQFTEAQPAARIRNVASIEHGPKSLDRKQWYRLKRCVEQARGVQGIRDRCIVVLLYHTGLRAGELATVRLDDLVLGERSGHLHVRRGKGNKARRVPLNSEARTAVRDYLQVRPASEVQQLCVGPRCEPLSAPAIYRVVVQYVHLARLDYVPPPTLRHSFARALLAAGTPLTDVAHLRGHSNLDTTPSSTRASSTVLSSAEPRLEKNS